MAMPMAQPMTGYGVPMRTYEPSLAKEAAENKEPLRKMRESGRRDDAFLYAIRASAYTEILYVHGLQEFTYSLELGRMVNLRDYDEDRLSVIFNVILPMVNGRISLLISRQPRRDTYATTTDEIDIEAAQYAKDAMDWGAEYHQIDRIAREVADWVVKTGNAFVCTEWDPMGGNAVHMPDGQTIFTGAPDIRVRSLFETTLHPHASTVERSPYVHFDGLYPKSFVDEHFPDKAHLIPMDQEYTVDSSRMFQKALLNMSPSHGGWLGAGWDGQAPTGESFVEIQTLYERSSAIRPQGRMIMCVARGGDPYLLLKDGPNPYVCHKTGRRTLPVTHFKDIHVTGRLLGESMVRHAMPHQDAINQFRGQIYRNCELVANPQLLIQHDGVAPESVTNQVGGIIKYANGSQPPQFWMPPPLPNYLLDAENAALRFLDIMTEPTGPSSPENQKNITSGIQQMIVNEMNQQQIAPLVRDWEMGWDDVWKKWIDNWRTFSVIPQQIGVVGSNNSWKQVAFSGELARKNFVVHIEPWSARPLSRTATFAEWMELTKAGIAMPQIDPSHARQIWNDLDKPGMARTYRDQNLDLEKARRNLMKVRQGQMVLAEPQDDPSIHLSVYDNFMKTKEWDDALQQDPELEFRMGLLKDTFVRAQQLQMMAMQAQVQAMAVAQAGGPENMPAARQGGSAKKPSGGRGGDVGQHSMSQGLSQAHNQVFNPGGPKGT